MDIRKAYNEWSDSYDADGNLTRDLDGRIVHSALAGLRFESILEIGCGTGKNTVFLAEIGSKVHALDFSDGMIEKAREKVRAGNVRFSMADLTERWPCQDEAYDLIVCCLVLEHIEDLGHIFSEAERALQPAGKFLINELHPFRQYEGKRARFSRGEETVEVEAFVHHISDFTKAAKASGLRWTEFEEYWHEADENKPPRIVSFLFQKP